MDAFIFGTVEGATLALIALGFSLVYGVGGILNLAHGAFYLMTCYGLYWTYDKLALDLGFPITTSLLIAIIVGVVVVIGVGIITYFALIKPLEHNEIAIVIATFALAFLLEQFVRVFGDPQTHFIPYLIKGTIVVGGTSFPTQFLLTVAGSLILVLCVTLFINKSKMGKSIRAVSQDHEAAKLMGIDTHKVLLITVLISALLVGFAAVLYIPGNTIRPDRGWSILLSAFAVTIFGGMGSIPGSILGAFIMGYATSFSSTYISTAFSDLIPIIVIVVMLVIRPQGLLGKKEVK